MKSIGRMLTILAVILMTFGGAYAQFAKSGDAIRYRKSVMFLIAQHFKQMGAVVKGKAEYDKNKFAANATLLNTLAALPWEASMTPGTDKGETTMNSAVFSKAIEFKREIEAFERSTAALATAAGSGEMSQIKTKFNNVAGNCKSCHSGFRTK